MTGMIQEEKSCDSVISAEMRRRVRRILEVSSRRRIEGH